MGCHEIERLLGWFVGATGQVGGNSQLDQQPGRNRDRDGYHVRPIGLDAEERDHGEHAHNTDHVADALPKQQMHTAAHHLSLELGILS